MAKKMVVGASLLFLISIGVCTLSMASDHGDGAALVTAVKSGAKTVTDFSKFSLGELWGRPDAESGPCTVAELRPIRRFSLFGQVLCRTGAHDFRASEGEVRSVSTDTAGHTSSFGASIYLFFSKHLDIACFVQGSHTTNRLKSNFVAPYVPDGSEAVIYVPDTYQERYSAWFFTPGIQGDVRHVWHLPRITWRIGPNLWGKGYAVNEGRKLNFMVGPMFGLGAVRTIFGHKH